MYIVIEIQKNADGVVSNIVTTYENMREAESHYHSVLASAAISTLPIHSVIILTEEGFPVTYQCYKHETAETD